MAHDYIYAVNKRTMRIPMAGFPPTRQPYGEIQTEFNMGNTIDGGKDSFKIEVHSFEENAIEPNTIIYHSATNSWWITKKDDVKRYMNDSGFYYIHTIQLNGAIDLLANRDMTDLGFYQNKYTIDTFIKRLFKHSNFEFKDNRLEINYHNSIDQNKVVNYIKSFENYTLLSALREFLDGYNLCAKLSFHFNALGIITKAIISIIPKTGRLDLPLFDADSLKDTRESRAFDKGSFGTNVISNANNVVSTEAKTFPSVGNAKLSAEDSYTIEASNAVLRLPSHIFKINWLKVINPTKLNIQFKRIWGGATSDHIETTFQYIMPENTTMSLFYDQFVEQAKQLCIDKGEPQQIVDEVERYFVSYKGTCIDTIKKACCQTLYTGWKVNAIDQGIVAPEDNPDFYFPRVTKVRNDGVTDPNAFSLASLLIGSEDDKASVKTPDRCMTYKRGENIIKNMRWICNQPTGIQALKTYLPSYIYTDLRTNRYDYSSNSGIRYVFNKIIYADNGVTWVIQVWLDNQEDVVFTPWTTRFVVNYIPMADLKIKESNRTYGQDTNVYNQNGKLNDSVALGQLIDSHLKEIKNQEITRFMHYTSLSDIPPVGSRTKINDEIYVVTNISYDFYPNESSNDNEVSYYIECQFTLSKYVATKSLMVNPNSNIRDYGIPQQYNVKRKQVYRDHYEFSFTPIDNNETPYATIDNYIVANYTTDLQQKQDHTAFIKITYASEVDGHTEWYYQLNSTVYVVKKSIYEVIDFNDNNIIGYDIQNSTSGFVLSRLWNNQYRILNVPISYVDSNGELEGIELAMLDRDNANQLYSDIQQATNQDFLLSGHVFIGEEIYNGTQDYVGAKDRADFILADNEYKKDPIEVPVFEYSMQFADTDDVVLGDNIFNSQIGKLVVYSAKFADLHSIYPLNAPLSFEELEVSGNTIPLDTENNEESAIYDAEIDLLVIGVDNQNYGVNWEYGTHNGHNCIRFKFYTENSAILKQLRDTKDFVVESSTFTNQIDITLDHDIVIYKTIYDKLYYDTTNEIVVSEPIQELFMIIHCDTDKMVIDGDDLIVYVNYAKLN